MENLNVEIPEDQFTALDNVIDGNPGWSKALVVRSLLSYFLQLGSNEQLDLLKKHRVVMTGRRKRK